MNRLIYLTLLLSFLALTDAHCQKVKFKYGAKIGANLATINNAESNMDFTAGSKTDFVAGAVFNLHWGFRNELSGLGTGLFGIQTEVLYSRQGFENEGKAINLDYLTIPVMLKLYPTKSLSLEAGPFFSALLSNEPNTVSLEGSIVPLEELKEGNSKDAGVAFGAAYEFAFGLTVGVRYNMGMSDVANNLQWQNRVTNITVGWLF